MLFSLLCVRLQNTCSSIHVHSFVHIHKAALSAQCTYTHSHRVQCIPATIFLWMHAIPFCWRRPSLRYSTGAALTTRSNLTFNHFSFARSLEISSTLLLLLLLMMCFAFILKVKWNASTWKSGAHFICWIIVEDIWPAKLMKDSVWKMTVFPPEKKKCWRSSSCSIQSHFLKWTNSETKCDLS